jgi:hypothetical protein
MIEAVVAPSRLAHSPYGLAGSRHGWFAQPQHGEGDWPRVLSQTYW